MFTLPAPQDRLEASLGNSNIIYISGDSGSSGAVLVVVAVRRRMLVENFFLSRKIVAASWFEHVLSRLLAPPFVYTSLQLARSNESAGYRSC